MATTGCPVALTIHLPSWDWVPGSSGQALDRAVHNCPLQRGCRLGTPTPHQWRRLDTQYLIGAKVNSGVTQGRLGVPAPPQTSVEARTLARPSLLCTPVAEARPRTSVFPQDERVGVWLLPGPAVCFLGPWAPSPGASLPRLLLTSLGSPRPCCRDPAGAWWGGEAVGSRAQGGQYSCWYGRGQAGGWACEDRLPGPTPSRSPSPCGTSR